MQTLYIDRKDTRIELDRERILVHTTNLARPLSIALDYLESIVISAKTMINSALLLACSSRGIAVIVLDARSYEHHAQYIPSHSGVVKRKIQQYALLDKDERRLGYAKHLVMSQHQQQTKLLHTLQKQYDVYTDEFSRLFTLLKNVGMMLANAHSMAELRGLEGASARVMFGAIAILAPEWCAFRGRNRRPPLDPINVLLSLSYSLVYAECTRALYACALDPMLGFYHEPVHGRFSLSCDLTERLRTDVERWVLSLVQQQIIQPQHFSYSEMYPCTLNKEGRSVYYPAWQQQLKIWRRYIRQNAVAWAKVIDSA